MDMGKQAANDGEPETESEMVTEAVTEVVVLAGMESNVAVLAETKVEF